ncbi:hypothetical protein [Streptomyces sp. NPDC051000]|uniref:hypothetical protein n=1 Tax=Streptomyces sp. NPDC051000 TaxID=3155520 RepID=UPI0033E229A7
MQRARRSLRSTVERALDRFGARGGGDLVADLALPVSTAAVAQLLGLTVERTGAWSS